MVHARKSLPAVRGEARRERRREVALLVGDGKPIERLRQRLTASGIRLVVAPEARLLAGAIALFEPFAVVAECSSYGSARELVAAVRTSSLYVPLVMMACQGKVEALFGEARCVLPDSDAATFLIAAARAAGRRQEVQRTI